MKLRLSHCSIRRSLKSVQRFHLCGLGVHSPCDPRHMNPPELAGWPGTHSPCSPRPSRQVISSTKGAIGAFFVSGRASPQTRAGCKRSIRYLSPSLERQARARGKVPDRPLARRRLPGVDRSCRSSNAVPVAGDQVAAVRDCIRSQRSVTVAGNRSGTIPRARVCLSKLGEWSRTGCLQLPPACLCDRRLALSRPTSPAPPHPVAAGRAAGWIAGSARAGTPSGRPARAGPSGRCTPRNWA